MKLAKKTWITFIAAVLLGIALFFSSSPNLNDPDLATDSIIGRLDSVNSYKDNQDIFIYLNDDERTYLIQYEIENNLRKVLERYIDSTLEIQTVVHFSLLNPNGNLKYVTRITSSNSGNVLFQIKLD